MRHIAPALSLALLLAAAPALAQQSGGENPVPGECATPLQVPTMRQDGGRWFATIRNPNTTNVVVSLVWTPAPAGFSWMHFTGLELGWGHSREMQIGIATLPTTEAEIRRTFTLRCMESTRGGWRRPGG